jgi:hypothetical protein
MSEQTTPGSEPGGRGDDGTFTDEANGNRGRTESSREWLAQLQAMIDNLATHASPVIREIGAKAAELAVVAGEKAGPIAHRAAEVTTQAGSKVAERGRVVAADLRREAAERREAIDRTEDRASDDADRV